MQQGRMGFGSRTLKLQVPHKKWVTQLGMRPFQKKYGNVSCLVGLRVKAVQMH